VRYNLSDHTDIVSALGRELVHSPEIEHAVRLALARLTDEERELIVNKVKLGVPTTALMKRFNIGRASSCESLYQRTLAILRIYTAYFAQAEDAELWRQLPHRVRIYGHLLLQIFSGYDRNCLIADTDLTGDELDAQVECAAKAAESIRDKETKILVEAAVALWPFKRLGSTPPKRDAAPARKTYSRRMN
jgi:hypothetical protein